LYLGKDARSTICLGPLWFQYVLSTFLLMPHYPSVSDASHLSASDASYSVSDASHRAVFDASCPDG